MGGDWGEKEEERGRDRKSEEERARERGREGERDASAVG
jgi:hypothetical protein